jgi:hypothetical protein
MFRQPREENPAYLAWVRTLPCTVCTRPGPNDPAHLRSAARQYGKRQTGMAEKPDDKWVLPLCRTHHTDQHRHNELDWWARQGFPDPFALATALYASCPVPTRPRQARSKPTSTRKPPEQRAKIHQRKTEWPSRKFQKRETV